MIFVKFWSLQLSRSSFRRQVNVRNVQSRARHRRRDLRAQCFDIGVNQDGRIGVLCWAARHITCHLTGKDRPCHHWLPLVPVTSHRLRAEIHTDSLAGHTANVITSVTELILVRSHHVHLSLSLLRIHVRRLCQWLVTPRTSHTGEIEDSPGHTCPPRTVQYG